jgi:hypothetical protein
MTDTVKTYLDRVVSLETDLSYLQKSIEQSFSKQKLDPSYNQREQAEIQQSMDEEKMYDRKFNDANAELQALGGKTRQQTLQEFVLLFFYVSFLVITIASTIFVYTQQQSIQEAAKVLGLFVLIGIVSLGVIARYV